MDPMLLALAGSAGVALVPEMIARAKTKPASEPWGDGLEDYLPHRRLVRPDVIKGERSFLAVWRIAAPDAGMLPVATIKNTAHQVAATLGLLGGQGQAQFYMVRSPFVEYDRGLSAGDYPVLELLDDLRRQQFVHRQPVFDTELYFALTWAAPNAMQEALRSAISVGVDAQRRSEDEMLASFDSFCERIEASLRVALPAESKATCDRLGEVFEDGFRRSELLRFVARMISGEDKPFNVPPATIPLNRLLARGFMGGYDVRVGNDEIGCVEFISPPDWAAPHLLAKLTELAIPHTLMVRVAGMSIQEAHSAINAGVIDFLGSASMGTSFVNPADERAAEQMTEAYGDSGEDEKRVGWTTMLAVVRAKTRREVIVAQQKIIDALESSGFRAEASKETAFDAFLATVPGQRPRKHGMRQHLVDALTIAKVVPLHERSKGPRYSASTTFPPGVRVPCVSYALGRGNSPRRIHLNAGQLFHGIMAGQTGRGKSVLLSYLAAMFRCRLPLASVTIIDRKLSARPTCLMLGGTHYEILGPRSPQFALFSGAHREDEERELLEILVEMATLQGVEMNPDRRKSLLEAIRLLASWNVEERSLFAYCEMLGSQLDGHILAPAIEAYGCDGILRDTFNGSMDSFEASRFNVIDLGKVPKDEKFLIPLLRVIFWKLAAHERRLKASLGEDLHSLFFVDEAHAVLAHPLGAAWALDQHKEGRKSDRGLWLVSNSPDDFARLPRLDDLLKASQTRLYSHDPGALDPGTVKTYEALGLPERGRKMLPLIGEWSVVLHSPDTSTLCEVDFKLDADVRAVLGNSHTNGLVDRYLEAWPAEQYGPQRWKTEMLLADPSPRTRAAGTRLQQILARSGVDEESAGALLAPSGGS